MPAYFAMLDQSNMLVGPWSDNNYLVEIVGTIRPQSLGNGTNNTTNTTFISLYLPDLMLMATMIYISGYQRNFGRQSDDPQMAQSYESQYQALLKGAMVEEARKKFGDGAPFEIEDRPDPRLFTISFLVGSKYGGDQPLPLFARVVLVDVFNELRNYGFNVTLGFIKIDLA